MAQEKNEKLPATLESQDIFERFDRLDDKLILKELENQVVSTWVYHFIVEGHHIWGLSKVGIDACTRRMGEKGIALREDYVNYNVDPTNPEFVLFTASVSKHIIDKEGHEAGIESSIGTKRQWIMQKRRSDGKLIANKFWFEQGSQKALRNAKARLIPDDIKTKVISYAKTHEKVREIEPPAKKKEENSIADMASQPNPKEEFRTIPITCKGKTVMHTKFEALDRFKEAKTQLGKELYYKILGENGYEKSNQIPDKDIPKIYYALIEAHKGMKPGSKKSPAEKKAAVFPSDEEKEPEAPAETPEKIEPELPLQQEIMELTRLEATLVDKHDFTPDQIIEKLKEMFGESDGTKLTKEQNKEAIKYFEGAIEELNKGK